MALSKPSLGIQSPILCQLCEKDPKISWKCLECDLLMCSACKNNIHPKIKTAGEHKIIAIKDIGSTSSQVPSKIDMTVVETYQTNFERVYELAISLDDSMWIGDGDHKKGMRLFSSHKGLQKVKCEGSKIKVISSFNTDIFDIAVTPENDLIMITDDSILKQIKSGTNKVVDTIYNLDPYIPLSIHVTRKFKLIVGTYVTREKGVVIVMDHVGNRENVYGEDQSKDISMSYPARITVTNNDNIFVADHGIGRTEGRVIVLGRGGIINTYSGHLVINAKKRFMPRDLTTTPADNVIVVDMYTDTLHILNHSGQLVTYISTKDKGILLPCSIALTMAGQFCMLYIGTPEDESKDAKIYKLNLIVNRMSENRNATHGQTQHAVYDIDIAPGNGLIKADDESKLKQMKSGTIKIEGNVFNTYSGNSAINTEDTPFTPYDLTTTPTDNVVVVDGRNILHILYSLGYLVTHINTEDKTIRYPNSKGLAIEEQSCML